MLEEIIEKNGFTVHLSFQEKRWPYSLTEMAIKC